MVTAASILISIQYTLYQVLSSTLVVIHHLRSTWAAGEVTCFVSLPRSNVQLTWSYTARIHCQNGQRALIYFCRNGMILTATFASKAAHVRPVNLPFSVNLFMYDNCFAETRIAMPCPVQYFITFTYLLKL